MSTPRCIDCNRPFYRDDGEAWKVRCFACWLATKKAPEASTRRHEPDPIRDELAENLPALLMLAHPDKHNGSALANRVTAWLLDVRRRLPVFERTA